MDKVKDIIKKLGLKPHPEGGFFRETYRSVGEILPESLGADYDGKRNYATGIYFLLTSDSFSAFHRIRQDEMWHFYDGSPLKLHVISETGKYSTQILGRNLDNGELPQIVISGGNWFAATVVDADSYTLTGCTVSPGFDFTDFELAHREELISLFPQLQKVITELTVS
jgi:predicted cupin superfamily sugar epimerase